MQQKLLKLLGRRPPAMVLRLLKFVPLLPPLLIGGLFVFLAIYIAHHGLLDFESRGIIATKERNLMIFALVLSLVVVIPVFILLFSFAWKYREKNTKSVYSPNLDGSRLAETIWWLIPRALIAVLSVVTWTSSHELDPRRALVSNVAPIHVQVVSLDWKWLFIYPDQQVASVNELHIPVGTPVDFSLTSDAPMNSFWIPQLGGQIYTMPGMSMPLHLMASKAGNYHGQSANISGVGFAGMVFTTRATSQAEFDTWVKAAKQTGHGLDDQSYAQLARPSEYNRAASYALLSNNLYDTIIAKYTGPDSTMMRMGNDSSMASMNNMEQMQ